jgi:hypothetical protein
MMEELKPSLNFKLPGTVKEVYDIEGPNWIHFGERLQRMATDECIVIE